MRLRVLRGVVAQLVVLWASLRIFESCTQASPPFTKAQVVLPKGRPFFKGQLATENHVLCSDKVVAYCFVMLT